jgi:peptide/nickel transport system permease protein
MLKRVAWSAIAMSVLALVAWVCARHAAPDSPTCLSASRHVACPYTVGDAVSHLLHGRLVTSAGVGGTVRSTVSDAAGHSFALVAGALVLALAAAWPLSRLPRLALRPVSAALMGVISVEVGLVLAYYLGFRWHLAPVVRYCDLFSPRKGCNGAADWAHHLLLPWISLSLWPAAVYARSLQGARERCARRGEQVDARRDLLAPIVQMVSTDFGAFLGWSILVELTFDLNGLGRMLFVSISETNVDNPDLMFGALIGAAALALGVKLAIDPIWIYLRRPPVQPQCASARA